MESTTVRYDFSFPPKSQANNGGGYQQNAPPPNNYRHQNNNQHFNMSKSVSSSLLSCATTNNYQQHSVASTNSGGRFRGGNNTCYGCTGSNRCQYHHNRNYNRGGQQQYQYQQQQQQQQQAQLSQSSSQSSIQTVTSSGSLNGSGPTIVAPGTPKDGNCSFSNINNRTFSRLLIWLFLCCISLFWSVRWAQEHIVVHGWFAACEYIVEHSCNHKHTNHVNGESRSCGRGFVDAFGRLVLFWSLLGFSCLVVVQPIAQIDLEPNDSILVFVGFVSLCCLYFACFYELVE